MEFKNVKKHFGDLDLSLPNLKIPKGKIILILGASGSGKTSFLHLAAGFIEPDSGDIYSDEHCALMLQNPFHQVIMPRVRDELGFPLKNAKFPPKEINSAVEICAEMCGIAHLLHREIRTLSFGETQLVTLGATLLSSADIYLFDEPASHLDPPSVNNFYKILRNKLTPKKSMLVVSQNSDEYIYSDEIWILENGRFEKKIRRDAFMDFTAGTDYEPDTCRIHEILGDFRRGYICSK